MTRGLERLAGLASARPLRLPERPFLFLRHGETDGNRARRYQAPEEALNATGLEQARRAAAALAGHRPDRILASTMRRAWQTATVVGRALDVPVTETPGLRERFFGALVGTSSAELDWAAMPPGGEALEDFVARTRTAVEEALAGGGRPLLVAHGGTLLVLAAALGCTLPPANVRNALPLLFTPGGDGWTSRPLAPCIEDGGRVESPHSSIS